MVNRVLSSSERLNVMLRICHSCIKPTLQSAVFCIFLGTLATVQAQESKSALSVEDVNALIPVIEAAERRLLNLKVESEKIISIRAVAANSYLRFLDRLVRRQSQWQGKGRCA